MSKNEDPLYRNSLYEPAMKIYQTNPHAGEPFAEDGYVPSNRYAKPGPMGLMPSIQEVNYKVLNDPVLIKKKQELRAALKEEYYRQAYNPYKHASGAGGIPFDNGQVRYIALLRTQLRYFRPTPRTTFFGVALYFLPVILMFRFFVRKQSEKERKFRSGLVAYKDRDYKFIS